MSGSYQFINKGDGQAGNTDRAYNLAWLPAKGWIEWHVFVGTSTYGTLTVLTPRNQWVHVAGTYNQAEGRISLYTNGVLFASTTNNAAGTPILVGQPIRQTSRPLVFGCIPGLGGTFADGFMDEARVWSRALSAQEIAQTFACKLTGQEAGLEAYWDFENGTVTDTTGHGHNGTLSGGASRLRRILM